MNYPISQEFKDYASFSVRVDRFFDTVNVLGLYYNYLEAMSSQLPNQEIIRDTIENNSINDEMINFIQSAYGMLNYMSTFSGFPMEDKLSSEDIQKDIMNFSFYTCFCFQWALFENFIKKIINKALNAGVVSQDKHIELKKRWRNTKSFLDFINNEQVFTQNPFIIDLPIMSWVPQVETCDYTDLNEIRKLRNDLIHGIEKPEITSESLGEKQKRYKRSMWILRKFAENIQHEVNSLLESKKE